MKKKITIEIETEEENHKIEACLRVYLLDALRDRKQIKSIKVEDIS